MAELVGQLVGRIEQVWILRKQRPEHRQYRLVARDQCPERLVDHDVLAQQDIHEAWRRRWRASCTVGLELDLVVLAFLAQLIECRLPCPGLPDPSDAHAVGIGDAAVGLPAEPRHAVDDLALDAGLTHGVLHEERVISFLGVGVLHDVQHIVDDAVIAMAPGAREELLQILAGVLGPLALNLAGLHVARRGIAVVFVNLESALRQAEVEAPGDHLIAAVAP